MRNSFLKTRWFTPSHRIVKDCPQALRSCLTEPGSLIQQLQHYCSGEINLSLSAQSWKRPLKEESQRLKLSIDEYALVREIQLSCDDTPWIHARSVIPIKTYRKRQLQFSRLGKQPLGSLLFSDNEIFRHELEIGKINTHDMFKPSSAIHQNLLREQLLWSRRSVFKVAGQPLLVTEIFLPGINSCIS